MQKHVLPSTPISVECKKNLRMYLLKENISWFKILKINAYLEKYTAKKALPQKQFYLLFILFWFEKF